MKTVHRIDINTSSPLGSAWKNDTKTVLYFSSANDAAIFKSFIEYKMREFNIPNSLLRLFNRQNNQSFDYTKITEALHKVNTFFEGICTDIRINIDQTFYFSISSDDMFDLESIIKDGGLDEEELMFIKNEQIKTVIE